MRKAYHGGYSIVKTAKALGIGSETVKKIEAEALEKIERILEERGISFDDLI